MVEICEQMGTNSRNVSHGKTFVKQYDTSYNRPASVQCQGWASHIVSTIQLLLSIMSGIEQFVSRTAG
jgi:hypothetical protein